VDGDDNLITANSFNVTYAGSSMIGDGGTGNVETLNKGQTYKVPIDLSRCSFQSDWRFDFAVGVKTQLWITGDTGNDSLWIGFTSADIPEGASITKIELYVTGSGLPHRVKWFRQSALATGSATDISAFVDQATDPETIVLTPTGGESPQYVKKDMIYTVQVLNHTASTGGVYGIVITYEL
jgi:hypothetical protein